MVIPALRIFLYFLLAGPVAASTTNKKEPLHSNNSTYCYSSPQQAQQGYSAILSRWYDHGLLGCKRRPATYSQPDLTTPRLRTANVLTAYLKEPHAPRAGRIDHLLQQKALQKVAAKKIQSRQRGVSARKRAAALRTEREAEKAREAAENARKEAEIAERKRLGEPVEVEVRSISGELLLQTVLRFDKEVQALQQLVDDTLLGVGSVVFSVERAVVEEQEHRRLGPVLKEPAQDVGVLAPIAKKNRLLLRNMAGKLVFQEGPPGRGASLQHKNLRDFLVMLQSKELFPSAQSLEVKRNGVPLAGAESLSDLSTDLQSGDIVVLRIAGAAPGSAGHDVKVVCPLDHEAMSLRQQAENLRRAQLENCQEREISINGGSFGRSGFFHVLFK